MRRQTNINRAQSLRTSFARTLCLSVRDEFSHEPANQIEPNHCEQINSLSWHLTIRVERIIPYITELSQSQKRTQYFSTTYVYLSPHFFNSFDSFGRFSTAPVSALCATCRVSAPTRAPSPRARYKTQNTDTHSKRTHTHTHKRTRKKHS